jgi:CheY-like chemotaxis protein
MLVEDEHRLKVVLRSVLRRWGYTVLDAADGDAALRVSADHVGPIDLLITDVLLPGIRGPELAVRMRAARPDIKVLLISGYTGGIEGARDSADPTTPFLAKPFTQEELARKVRQVLDTSGGGIVS